MKATEFFLAILGRVGALCEANEVSLPGPPRKPRHSFKWSPYVFPRENRFFTSFRRTKDTGVRSSSGEYFTRYSIFYLSPISNRIILPVSLFLSDINIIFRHKRNEISREATPGIDRVFDRNDFRTGLYRSPS